MMTCPKFKLIYLFQILSALNIRLLACNCKTCKTPFKHGHIYVKIKISNYNSIAQFMKINYRYDGKQIVIKYGRR